MKKNNLIDFLILVLAYIALSCFPFGLIIRDENLSWLILVLQIVIQVGLLVFIFLFTFFKTKLNHQDGKINVLNTVLLIPTLAVCFTNFTNLRIATGESVIPVNTDLFLSILLTVFVVINEEILFRLILINNLEIKNKLLIILISAGAFGICHITHFLTSFNPIALLVIVYTFLLGLLLGFAYLFTKSLYPCVIIHLLFNSLNNILFPYFVLEWAYILITAIFVVSVGIYVTLLFILRLNKEKEPEEVE